MFTTIKPKEIISSQEQGDELLISHLFYYIDNNNKDKIISYITNPSYKIWEFKDSNGLTILHKSVLKNNTSLSITIIKEIKKKLGFTPTFTSFINSTTIKGLTPLHYAAYKGNLELSKYLIQNGANVNALTKLGKNMIHMSAEGNHPSLMIYYISKRVMDISEPDYNGSTALHWACFSGAVHSVKFLLALHAEINAMDKKEITPLHLACYFKREDIVIKLLQNGAIKEMENIRGEKGLYISKKKRDKKIYDILKKKEGNNILNIEEPLSYSKPNNAYKKIILIIYFIYEILIMIMILPFIKNISDILFNNFLFIFDFIFLIILFKKDPGYKINLDLNKKKDNESIMSYNRYPLLDLIEKNIDIRNYCPKCYIPVINKIKHCIICDKCVEDYNYHCFWINKCIGKKNKIIYIIYIIFTLIFVYDSCYMSLLAIFNLEDIPYENLIYLSIFRILKDREIRIFFSGLIAIFSIFISMPLNYLFMNEIFKCLKKLNLCTYGEKRICINKNKYMTELEVKKINEKEVKILEEDEGNDFLGINRETKNKTKISKIDNTEINCINNDDDNENDNDNDILSHISKNTGSISSVPQTPFLNENNLLIAKDENFSED